MEKIAVSHVNMEYHTKRQGPLQVLCDVNISVETGEFYTVIGPSGCGKSTILNIIAGLLSPTTGDVSLDGARLTGPSPDKMAMVFQDPTLLPWRTVRANVEFPLEARGVRKTVRRETATEYLSLVGLSEFAGYFPGQLSGGMKQRVAMARALAQEPEVLLMDEPFGALDEQTRIVLGEELTKIWQKTGKTIVFVTHSLTEAAFLSDTIAILSARPGTIRDTIDVTVPRPREPESLGLSDIRRRLWGQIKDEAAKQAIEV